MIDLVTIGLIVIALAWVVQLFLSWKSSKIQPAFIALYLLGVLSLIAAGYVSNSPVSPYEIFSFLAALAVLIKVLMLKKR